MDEADVDVGAGYPCNVSHQHGSPASRIEFIRRKQQILASLDRSPKGSLDAPIVDFLTWLNAQTNVVTTSSCSGRIAIFLGSSNPANSKGGEWLLCSHEEVTDAAAAWTDVNDALKKQRSESLQDTLVTFLLEPFLLHAECADVETAQCVLECAREVGLRESGLSLGRRRVIVQLRSVALRLEVPLALNGEFLVDSNYFQVLVRMGNERLTENARRTTRLWESLRAKLAARTAGAQQESVRAIPWVFVCPQPLARGIKLAIEEKGWMDDSRKMAPFKDIDKLASSRIGVPISSAGADFLQALPVAEREASSRTNAAGTATFLAQPNVAAEGDDAVQAPGTNVDNKNVKAARAAAALRAADIESVWQNSVGEILLVQSDTLPLKKVPVQNGNAGDAANLAAARQSDALVQAASEVHAKFCKNASEWPLAMLLAEVRSLGPLQWRGDVALLPRDALTGCACEHLALESKGAFWEPLRIAAGARLLARQREIRVDSEVRGGAVDVLAGSGDGWVIVPGPKGVRYTFDITRCMFSEGNAAEKARVAEWQMQGKTVLDLYAGIGFWTLPLLIAGADHVVSCEWNPDAIEALHRGLALLGTDLSTRCEVLPGDNRRQEVVDIITGRCDHVMMGLIPTCRDSFPVSVQALKSTGGMLHVHWNVASDSETTTAEAIASELQTIFQSARGEGWRCCVEHVQRIKWYAPRVRHVRIDVACHCIDSAS